MQAPNGWYWVLAVDRARVDRIGSLPYGLEEKHLAFARPRAQYAVLRRRGRYRHLRPRGLQHETL
jgi:hypothetical protein